MAGGNGEFGAGDVVDPADFPEEGGPGGTLNPSEGADSNEAHNDDGATVVDEDAAPDFTQRKQ